jgi:two-component system nitrate/nitrite response regulator NarL
VVVADGLPLYRDALARAIRQDSALELVAEAADLEELAQALRRHRPAVAIVDAELLPPEQPLPPGSTTRTLVLASRLDAAGAFAAIEAGASGYLSRDASSDAVRIAIAAVAAGQTLLDPAVQTGVAGEIRVRMRDERPVLSGREREILGLIADGLTARQIGQRLHISTATVKTHVLHLYDKLDVTDRAAAVAEAMRRGLLE